MRALIVAVVSLWSVSAYAQAPAAVKDLKLEIPATKYVLKNGLTLIVHEDKKAPIVAVQVWYKVGSRDEPQGRSGFAHLFEHLMFNGTEHADTDWFKPVRALGATNINGTTNGDRTNYFQTVPKGALDAILWLESDRMGHFINGVTQAKLDEQRGVVQNEKRQSENRPYGLTYEQSRRATYPVGHPYAHTTIGSMDDLNAATLDDVRGWFRDWYGPSNAILVLSGDVSPAEALEKVERAFGDIPPGPPVTRATAWVAKRTGLQRELSYDQVAQPRIMKIWNVPQMGERDTVLLNLAADALSGGRTSPLYKRLVHDEQVATSVSAYVDNNEIAGQFYITADVKPDADVAKVEAALDEELARLLKDGPSQEALDLARMTDAAQMARALESASRKASMLVSAEAQFGSPDAWRREFDMSLTATPAEVRAAANRWLSDGQYVLTVLPQPALSASAQGVDRSKIPTPTVTQAKGLPAFERATLANGLKLVVATRREAPLVNFALSFETGVSAADAALPPGAVGLTLELLNEGTTSRTGLQISDEQRRLGANLDAGGDDERAQVTLNTLTSTLDPSLALFADVALNPAFREEDIERLRRQWIVSVERARREPASMANRVLRPLVFGADHPYGRTMTEASLKAFTRDQAVAYHRRWFTPENATLVVVGDTTLADIRPKIERAFAKWTKGAVVERMPIPDAPSAKPGVYVVDRPGAQQSYIVAAVAAPRWNAADDLALMLMNDSFGGTFTSRLNMNLREDKGWSYGARSVVSGRGRGPQSYQLAAPVQTDRTAESFIEMRREYAELASTRPVTADELARSKNDIVLGLAGRWETLGAVNGGIGEILYRGLPDDYWSSYADRVNATTQAEIAAATAKVARPAEMIWVIVGDRARIVADFEKHRLGPVTVLDADGVRAE